MKARRTWAMMAVIGALAGTAGAAGPGAAGAAATTSSAAAWRDLFDGRTLDGWEVKQGTAKWEVVDGAIVGTTVLGSPNSFLCTTRNYGDFVLELDFKADEGLNSGVQIRSESNKAYRDGRVHGYQVEIDPAVKQTYKGSPPNLRADGTEVPPGTEPRRWTGGIQDEAGRSWLSNLTKNEAARNAFRPEQWNHFRVEAIGDTMRVWLNGVPAGVVTDSVARTGFIGLQVHATKNPTPTRVWFKNIRIQDLGPNDAPATKPSRG